jgi:hypothetical protein
VVLVVALRLAVLQHQAQVAAALADMLLHL